MIESLEQLKEAIIDSGYEEVIVFDNPSYYSAFIGISGDNRAIYDYEKMIEFLIVEEEMSLEEAVELIDYNSSYNVGEGCPIINYSLLEFV